MKMMAKTTKNMAEEMETLNQSLIYLLRLKQFVEQLIPAAVVIRSVNQDGRSEGAVQNS